MNAVKSTQSRNGKRRTDRKMGDRKIKRNPIFMSSIFLSVLPAPLRLCRAMPLRWLRGVEVLALPVISGGIALAVFMLREW
jgi:hypothetical protein